MAITCTCLFLQPGGKKLAIDSSWVTEIYYDLDLLLTNFFFLLYIFRCHIPLDSHKLFNHSFSVFSFSREKYAVLIIL